MKAVDITKVKLRNINNIRCTLTWNKMSHLRETIDHQINRVATMLSTGKAKDEVHANIRSWMHQNRKGQVRHVGFLHALEKRMDHLCKNPGTSQSHAHECASPSEGHGDDSKHQLHDLKHLPYA
ncbi:hypothetical protein Tco_1469885 [Tanacetum coccineum]